MKIDSREYLRNNTKSRSFRIVFDERGKKWIRSIAKAVETPLHQMNKAKFEEEADRRRLRKLSKPKAETKSQKPEMVKGKR